MLKAADKADGLQAAIMLERARLVRLCDQLTGDKDAAEDLAQEALLVAWRNVHRLYAAEVRSQWLAGIARNLCLHWARRRRHEVRRLVQLSEEQDSLSVENLLADEFDLEEELERAELARLLDRALALLPPDTRKALIEHFIKELPQAEIAAKLGVSVDVVEARIRRGKLALRRVLTTELSQEAITFGFITRDTAGWQETRIWCSGCGQRCLMIRFAQSPGSVAFRCPHCQRTPNDLSSEYRLTNPRIAAAINGLTQPRAVLRKMSAWGHEHFRRALAEGAFTCDGCGHNTRVRIFPPDDPSELGWSMDELAVYGLCEVCGWADFASLGGLVENLPEVQHFWSEHTRIRRHPHRQIEAEGGPAVVTRFENVTGRARLDVVSARDTFRVLHISRG